MSPEQVAYEAWLRSWGGTLPWSQVPESVKDGWRDAVDALRAHMHTEGECPICHQSKPQDDYEGAYDQEGA